MRHPYALAGHAHVTRTHTRTRARIMRGRTYAHEARAVPFAASSAQTIEPRVMALAPLPCLHVGGSPVRDFLGHDPEPIERKMMARFSMQTRRAPRRWYVAKCLGKDARSKRIWRLYSLSQPGMDGTPLGDFDRLTKIGAMLSRRGNVEINRDGAKTVAFHVSGTPA